MTTLVFLHGLGAHGGVWGPVLNAIPEGAPLERAVSVSLPGHGGGEWTGRYSLDDMAADAAEAIGGFADGRLIVVGHSLGGAVALALSSGRFGVRPDRVLGLGIKAVWTPEEAAWLAGLAGQPAKVFETREAAVDRFLKVAGLVGLADPDSEMAGAGVVREGDGWRLAADPRAAAVGPPPMDDLAAGALCPFHLAAGEHDPMSRLENLRRWDAEAEALPGLGHNAMVEDPAAVWAWIERTARLS